MSLTRSLALFLAATALATSPALAQSAEQEPQPRTWRYVWDDHPEVRAGSALRLEFRGRFQVDLSGSGTPGDATFDSIGWNLRRVGLRGDLFDAVEFELDYEMYDPTEPWRDLFVNYRQFRSIQLQAGQFKLPFSLDENTAPTSLDFVNRSRAADQLAPGRDRGVMAHGQVLRRRVEFELGVFERDGRNARTENPERTAGGRTIAGRVTAQPFRGTQSLAEDLRVGVAFASSQVPEGFPALRGLTSDDEVFYRSEYWTRGERRRLGLEARWRPGPFSAKAEFIQLTDERLGVSVDDADLSPIVATGWYVSGTWAVTGESKADGLTTPRRPVTDGGFGAIELALRIEGLSFQSRAAGEPPSDSPRADVISGSSDRVITVGVNWHPMRRVRLMWNLMRDTITRLDGLPGQDSPRRWAQAFRLQFVL